MKIYRPKTEPQALVIDLENGSMPAYIPVCALYALSVIMEIAEKQTAYPLKKPRAKKIKK